MKKYNIANDLGYSSLKMVINEKPILIPSLLVIQKEQYLKKPESFSNYEDAIPYLSELLSKMDVTVASPTVKLQGRFLIGHSAIASNLPTRSFDVNDFTGKSESDLSLIFTLATIANKAIMDTCSEQKNKPDEINDVIKVNVNMTTSLPISETKRDGVIERYSARYMNGKHLVTIHNFKQPIIVEIQFNNVYVGLEGEVAQFKIANADEKLKKLLKKDLDKNYPEYKDHVSGDDLISIKNVLGIDIGEGTTDFAVIIDGKANATSSTSLEVGYGNVLQESVSVLQQAGINIASRGELNTYLNKEVSAFAKSKQNKVREVVKDQFEQLVDQIIDTTSETLRRASSNIELVYVYGGGSIPLLTDSTLRERLSEKLRNFSGGYDVPVVWVDKSVAQKLNELGLDLILDALESE